MSAREPTRRAATSAQKDDKGLNLRQELVGEPETIAYIRVSGEVASLGLGALRTQLSSFAEEEGWTPLFLEDYGSSAARSRPGFEALMDAIRRGYVKQVLVASGHHLARNIEQSIAIRRLLRSNGGEVINISAPRG